MVKRMASRWPDGATYTEQVIVFMDPAMKDRLRALADRRGPYRLSEVVREALAHGLPLVESVEALRGQPDE